jgi:hypothetical protein
MVSDNSSSLEMPDDVTRWKKALGGAGIPVLAVTIGSVDEATTDEIVALSGGARIAATDPDLANRVRSFVAERSAAAIASSLRLLVTASSDGPAQRTLQVAMRAKPAVTTDSSYRVPASERRVEPPGVAGISLVITVNGVTTRRHIAGVEVDDRGTVRGPITATHVAEATATLDERVSLAFEVDAPTTAALADDAIGRMLSLEPVAARWADPLPQDTDYLNGLADLQVEPLALDAMFDALGGSEAGRADHAGVRAVLLGARRSGDRAEAWSDVVPVLNIAIGRGTDAAERWSTVFRQTLATSVREGRVLSAGIAAQLLARGATGLRYVAPNAAIPDEIGGTTTAARQALAAALTPYVASHRLVPADAAIAGGWVIDPDTGSVTAIGEHGRGNSGWGCFLPGNPAEDAPISSLLGWFSFAIGLITVRCLRPLTVPDQRGCDGANAVGVAAAVLGSFGNPAPRKIVLNLVGSALGIAGFYDPGSTLGRAIIWVLQLMTGLLVNRLNC